MTQTENCRGCYQERSSFGQCPTAHPRSFLSRCHPQGRRRSQRVSAAAARILKVCFSHHLVTSRTLINNAATTIGPFKLTADNIESQFATNHIGPFLLTKLLSSKPLATRTAQYTPRVVFISAASHAFRDGLNFSTLERPNPKDYDTLNAYFQTKVANVLTGNVYSLHPGGTSAVS